MKEKFEKEMDISYMSIYFFDLCIPSIVGQLTTFVNPLEIMEYLKNYNEILVSDNNLKKNKRKKHKYI